MRGTVWVAWLTAMIVAGVTSACDLPPGAEDQGTCAALCECVSTLPSQVEDCTAMCVTNLAPISDSCQSCVYDHVDRCSTLIQDCSGQCFGVPKEQGDS